MQNYYLISGFSIFLALFAALSIAYLLYKADWKPLNRLKKFAGNPLLFIAVVFSALLLLTGYLFRVLLMQMLLPLMLVDFLTTACLSYTWLSGWQRIRKIDYLQQNRPVRLAFITLISLLIATLFIFVLLLFLGRVVTPVMMV